MSCCQNRARRSVAAINVMKEEAQRGERHRATLREEDAASDARSATHRVGTLFALPASPWPPVAPSPVWVALPP
ncbi:uncharacterized protein DS421_19g647810 [Arachis hypogaea]|uniref:Uncharacterized protein n=1 Tax=Arachis hypogaea TaxID=3818 RepID=A0A6B9V763_ARAHY|nr:uncharacterized protein DS421_19g647810 [Arachis hypogaea]